MPTDDRDQLFQRALARHLSDASPDSACPDAELLAAYHDRTLSLDEIPHWKQHIATCPRCQEILALVEQTENLPVEDWQNQGVFESVVGAAIAKGASAPRSTVQPASTIASAAPVSASASASPPHRLRNRAAWHLLAPIGAIAAAVIVFVGVREIRQHRAQQLATSQIAENRSTVSQPISPPLPALTQPRQQELPAAGASDALRPSKPLPPAPLARAKSEELSASRAQPSLNNDLSAAKRKDAYPPVAPPPASSASGYVAANAPKESAPSAIIGGAAPVAPLEEKKARNEIVQPPAAAEQVQVQATAPELDATVSSKTLSAKQRDATALLKIAVGDPRFVIAPGVNHAWRLGDAGRIERTTNGGKTWKLQETSVAFDLTAGSATSDNVCWVVGKSGTLLLTTDGGKHWKVLPSPISGDLGGIHATDALHASIWDVPNRHSFETSDSGATWKPVANE